MSRTPKILAFAGSTREASYNKKVLRIAASAAQAAGAEVTLIDLRDFPMPLFDEDVERVEGAPEAAVRLKRLMVEHDGFLIASPEYNSSISGVLKNSFDWVSRPVPNEPPLVAFRGKTAILLSASLGGLGGLRGLVHIRSILNNVGATVLPDQVAIAKAQEAIDERGSLKDPKQQEAVEALGRTLARFVGKLIA
jgi:chromate reductase